MNGVREQFTTALRLYFRNRMGMFYNYLFPSVFLLAFQVLYRNEPVPLARHMGQLLTVTILGGACLGLPTTMVNERERGVWRRYRLAPIQVRDLLASTVLARFCIVVTAGLLQLALALAIGLPFPARPLQLCLSFTFVTCAFLSLGLIVAALADNVPAVQALGQCIFLPMLIVGGVAVPFTALPDWALHVSAYFPGRYAVESLQACFTTWSPGVSRFDLAALLVIALAGFAAGVAMFRWDAAQKLPSRNKAWLAVVIAAWAAVGTAAERRGAIFPPAPSPSASSRPQTTTPQTSTALPQSQSASPAPAAILHAGAPTASGAPLIRSTKWQDVTIAEINQNVDFNALPPDSDFVSPIARPGLDPPPDVAGQLDTLKAALPAWPPGNIADPEQRVRNLLYVAAVPDVQRLEIVESYIPLLVLDRLKQIIPKDDLVRLLYWVAVHPSGGDDTAAGQLQSLGLPDAPADRESVRERVSVYGLKLVGRLIGKIP